MGAEERWAQRKEWAEEKRRGFDACEEWDCDCWESHAWHIEDGQFNVEFCDACAEERCEGCKGTGLLAGEECHFCKGSGAIRRRRSNPPSPDVDDKED